MSELSNPIEIVETKSIHGSFPLLVSRSTKFIMTAPLCEADAIYRAMVERTPYSSCGMEVIIDEITLDPSKECPVICEVHAEQPTYEVLLGWMRKYVIDQKECGNPATMKDLREYRSWKNMPQDAEFDRALLEEIEKAST
jgi:hypothetical protein